MTRTTRRRFLAATAGATVGASLLATPATAQAGGGAGGTGDGGRSGDAVDLSAWFANTENVGEVVDARGQSSVEVAVGTSGNGGSFAFDPVAVRIDPGTTVVWTWTGEGGTHNVAAKDGSFTSEYYGSTGETFEHAFADPGVVRYSCVPHEAMGMKGAVVVGDADVTLGGGGGGGAGGDTDDAGETPTQPEETYDGWLANTDNYHALVDRRGESEVVVEVGAEGNGGQLAFDPPAMRVDPGTTVVWEWVGDLAYDVADPDLGFHSEQVAGAGHRFAVQFDGDGLSTYECTEYGDEGMRGVVVVGDGPTTRFSTLGYSVVGGSAVVLGAPFLYAFREHFRNITSSE
ncbi:halocyanin domain-containing protein [Halomarina salina]|uniref:Halocyanin domain-containing protein n=1 Tax=Halomarina salina TaxID=1872699 RepID=A0ABD5RTW7_9EURY|nr:halocyanin domain-containing protein [Halomarina salina]